MVEKKPKIVIIGAGMAGLTAANKLYSCNGFKDFFHLCVVEGGNRIGGRINSSEFCGDQIELGATYIHGIGGSPVHQIAQEIGALESEQPWECMDGLSEASITIAEGGFELDSSSTVKPMTQLYKNLMDFAKERKPSNKNENLSVGCFLKNGFDDYWGMKTEEEEILGFGNWNRRLIGESVFGIHENTERTYTSAGDLMTLDFDAESEYQMFPGEEITIAKGYSSIIQSLVSVLPSDLVQLGKRVVRIEWQGENGGNGDADRPVKLHFCDGVIMDADHVIVTVSLGVLKAGIHEDLGLFSPPLPYFKTDAISRLGFGVVNKLFLQWNSTRKCDSLDKFPYLQMAFHKHDSEFRDKRVPWWMRKTASLFPIYQNSSVLLSWFAGEEAIELESLNDEEIINGVSQTMSCFLPKPQLSNGCVKIKNNSKDIGVKFTKVLKTQWANDPLFLGSYSYVAVGSSGKDLDKLAEPLPQMDNGFPLQIMFAGEATHRTHYSTTHGAYFSGLREANRLLQHYHF